MQKPNLDVIWETFIKIPNTGSHIDIMRSQLCPLISRLKDKDIINWYSFLIHNRQSGVPTSEDDTSFYFHIRFDLRKTINPKDFLPDYCVMTRKVERTAIENISGINKFLLKGEQIEEAWKVIGEQSEWVMNMLNIHKEDTDVPTDQIAQFLHYYFNMTQLGFKCPECRHVFTF